MDTQNEIEKGIKMKKGWKRGIACVMAVLIFSQIFGAFPVNAEETDGEITGEITVASNVSKQDMQTYLDGFQKKYPGIQVNYEYHSDYDNEVGAEIESGDYPDVLFVPGSTPGDQYTKLFEPLGRLTELEKKYNYLETGIVSDDVVYGIPSSAYLNGFVYNKEVFDKAGVSETPKTIDEFLDALRMIRQRTNAIPFYTNYAADWPLKVWEQYPYLEMTGDPDYKNNGFVNELNPFLKGTSHYQVYDLLYNIVKEGLCESDPKSSDWEQSKGMLNNGEIGCIAIGSWALKQIQDAGEHAGNVGFMPFPNEIGGKQYASIATDYSYAVNRNSTQKEAAKCYISYMIDESGYALDHEVLSIVKTDPIVESYGDMDHVLCLNSNPATDENYKKRQKLAQNLNLLDSSDEIRRVIEAASGRRDEDFDTIAEDWNTRWESERTEDMMPESEKSISILSGALQQDYKVELSDTEKEYLKGIKELKFGYLKHMAPYQYETSQGAGGVVRDLIDILKEETGVSIKEMAYDTTNDMIAAIKKGEIDLAADIRKNSEYSGELRFSTDLLDHMVVVVTSDTSDTEHALQGIMAAADGEYPEVKTDRAKLLTTKSLTGSLRAVENLKADYTVADYYSVSYYMQEQGYTHLSLVPLSQNEKGYFAFSKDVDTRLISICNKVIYSIPDENKQIMLNNSMKTEQQQITIRRFIEANTIPCLLALILVFMIIVVVITIIMRDRARIAKTDALTGISNRYGIHDRMDQVYEKKKTPVVFAIMDIDNFKRVNDTLGHAGGDEALKLLADELNRMFAPKALIGRYGGDEFVLCMQGVDEEEAQEKIKQLVSEMNRSLSVGDKTVQMSISLGAVCVKQLPVYEELFKAADAVLYEVKQNGKNGFQIKNL